MINQIKNKLLKKHGTEPTICYYYYLWNVVDYAGEEVVRKSFKSITGQGDEIIIGNYCCTDNTKEIAKEYGFKVVDVECSKKFEFPESKVRNAVIHNSRSNYVVALNINVEYPKNLNDIIVDWLGKNPIERRALRFRSRFPHGQFYGFSTVIYKPYLLEARGYDERTSYGRGSQKYGAILIKEIYNLQIHAKDIGLIHKNNNPIKLPKLSNFFPRSDHKRRWGETSILINELKKNLKTNFRKGVSEVKNSYW